MEIIRARRTQLGRVEHERLQASSQLWSDRSCIRVYGPRSAERGHGQRVDAV